MSDDEVAWTCHPVRHRPVAGILAAIFIVALVVAVQWWVDIVFLTVLGALILVFSVLPFFLPTRYRLSEAEIEVRGVASTRTAPWEKYRSMYADRRGILLTPFFRPSRLDRIVGVNLRFDEPDRERVTAFVRRKMDERQAQIDA